MIFMGCVLLAAVGYDSKRRNGGFKIGKKKAATKRIKYQKFFISEVVREIYWKKSAKYSCTLRVRKRICGTQNKLELYYSKSKEERNETVQILVALVLVAIMVIGVIGCSAPATESSAPAASGDASASSDASPAADASKRQAANPYKIGIVVKQMGAPYFDYAAEGAKKAAAEMGAEGYFLHRSIF